MASGAQCNCVGVSMPPALPFTRSNMFDLIWCRLVGSKLGSKISGRARLALHRPDLERTRSGCDMTCAIFFRSSRLPLLRSRPNSARSNSAVRSPAASSTVRRCKGCGRRNRNHAIRRRMITDALQRFRRRPARPCAPLPDLAAQPRPELNWCTRFCSSLETVPSSEPSSRNN